jgi:hypothetical protein
MADKITKAVDASPYPKAPSIWIAYPQLDDWKTLFVPVLDPKRVIDARWLQAKYAFMKSSHETFVTTQLDAIVSKSTGQTLLLQFRASPKSVMIFPYVFAPDYVDDEVAATIAVELYAATAKNRLMLPTLSDGSPFCARKFDGTRICKGTGTGSAVDMYFWSADPLGLRSQTYGADDVLLHELTHALRMVSGVEYGRSVTGGYGNQEEFLAVLVTNMYRSNKNLPLFDYALNPINPNTFLDTRMSPTPRELIRRLRDRQPSLFAALKSVHAPFNPVKQFFDEL